MLFKKNKPGFTLVEAALVLSISIFIGFLAFSQLIKTQEYSKAQFAGAQIKTIGDSVNAYISNHYDLLSQLQNSANTSTDPGPRSCTISTNNCSITIATLVNEGLLPSTFSGKNVYGQGYNIVLKRSGTSPYYKINGLVLTDDTLRISGKVRYDLLGISMLEAGIDSGMTRDSSSVVSGFNGSWSQNFNDYNNITKSGLLAYQSGYGTYNYSVFLRRDGTLPMTGNLNMGSNNIQNVADYSGSGNIDTQGKINAGGDISSGGWLWAKNGYGDTIGLGGDAEGNDYELRMMEAKGLALYAPYLGKDEILLRTSDTVWDKNGTKVSGGKNSFILTKSGDITIAGGLKAKGDLTTEGEVLASGNIETGQYLNFKNAVIAGYSCSQIGLVSRDGAGQLLTCKAGIWTPEQPVGIPQPWPSTTPPAGWLVCNGQTFNTSAYPLLAKAYPSGRLPDLRGNYIRGLDQGRGYDDESNRAVLSEQKDAFQNHNHRLPTTTGYVPGSNQGDSSMNTLFRDYNDSVFITPDMDSSNALKNGNNASITNVSVLRTYDSNFSGSTPYADSPRTAKETRTKNIAFVYIVRAL